ncbi:methyl-accepting chemotaxis protein [Opitutus sp. ER46]|uniref:methyl-accepting chemotaxis protein n=1 Tax=Opitutus sp. ER46 TaxID=2161864 RepID=UPI000D2F5220|nr:methyl-accepting chemotaxis protein [Opitutus sp. ER46]PTX94291.1 hypothetical protein DB354_11045 [Opitutus sp. ER46]
MNTWTVGKRITVGYATVLLVTLAIGLFAASRLTVIGDHAGTLTRDAMPQVIALGQIQTNTVLANAYLLRHILLAEASQLKDLDEAVTTLAAANDKLYQVAQDGARTPEAKAAMAKVMAARDLYLKQRAAAFALSRGGQKTEAFVAYEKQVGPDFRALNAALQESVNHYRDEGGRAGNGITGAIVASKRFIFIGIVAALLLASGIGYLIVRATNRILVVTSESLDEGAAHVTAAAGQVSAASQMLAEGSSEQAASLEETSSSLEEMASMTKRNADNANHAKELSGQTRQAADTGTADMDEMKAAMSAIQESSTGVSKIIKTIDEIAFQTNILALNAAVEAARAGEAGMGFAVVADEVRNLAQRSAQSAKETTAKIEDAVAKAERGVAISARVAKSLAEIAEKTQKVDAIVGEIATASNEQSQGIDQLNTAVGQMDQVTQSNASNAEETASAAEELNGQALSLQDAVVELKKLVGGNAGAGRSAAVRTERGRPARAPQKLARVVKTPAKEAVIPSESTPPGTNGAAPRNGAIKIASPELNFRDV